MGRPKKEIDEAKVLELARIHCTYEEMASVLGCSTDTLKRRFAGLIEKGREEGKMSLRRAMFRAALDGDRALMIWLSKQHLGMSEKVTHQARDGQVVVNVHRPDAADPGP